MKKRIRHEKPLVGKDSNGKKVKNPNKISVNQHVIPKKHLLEWSQDGKGVSFVDIESKKAMKLPANNPYFCTMRKWDQWTEAKMLKSNEDNYQVQLDLLKKGNPFSFQEHVMAYYSMLCARISASSIEFPDSEPMFESISFECSKSELEENELEIFNDETGAHVVKGTLNPESQHMERQAVKMMMTLAFEQRCERLKDQSWKVFEAGDESFLMSDALHRNSCRGIHILPMTPKHALISGQTYEFLESKKLLSVECINNLMMNNAHKFFVRWE